MSTNLALHNDAQKRVFKLNPDSAETELKSFLSDHLVMVILGDFPNKTQLINSANHLCINGPSKQAAIWIKEDESLENVSNFISNQLTAFSYDKGFESVRAIAFKMDSHDIAYVIEKNPSSALRRFTKREMARAYSLGIKETQAL